jgi:hypothetical protein
MVLQESYQIHVLFLRRICPFCNQFYLLSEHEHSERWYHTSQPLSIMYDILLLINYTLLIVNLIFLCIKKPVPNSWVSSPFHRKMYIRLLVWRHPHPIWPLVLPLNVSYILIFLHNCPAWPALHRPLTFYITNLISIFFSLGNLSKESIQVWGPLWHFVTSLFFTVRRC